MENILNINEVSKILRISKATIYKYSERGQIPSFKIGACLRFKEKEIDDYLNKLCNEKSKQENN